MLPILLQDEHLVAVIKPAGLLVHRSEIDKHETRFLIQELRDQIGQKVFPVHRLDKPTSGAMVFALDIETQKKLSQQFEFNHVEKTYHALVRGYTPETATIDYPLKEKAVFKSQDKSSLPTREAITHYRTLESFEIDAAIDKYATSRYSLLEVKPLTGRRHQIRRHLKHISHPIIGDTSYGKTTHNQFFRNALNCQRLLLQATKLTFAHPITGKKTTLSCELDQDFRNLVNQLRQRSASN